MPSGINLVWQSADVASWDVKEKKSTHRSGETETTFPLSVKELHNCFIVLVNLSTQEHKTLVL